MSSREGLEIVGGAGGSVRSCGGRFALGKKEEKKNGISF